jgi:Right handed beta helix region
MRIVVLFLCLAASAAFAAVPGPNTYFVDAAAGNDAWSGANLSNSPAGTGPWRSVARVNQLPMGPGTKVYFKCGGVWREQLRVNGSGTAANPILIGQYGTCSASNAPLITAASPVGGWQVHSGNIYVASVSYHVKQVLVDGNPIELAHYPNRGYNAARPGSVFLPITSVGNSGGRLTIAASALNPPSADLAGAGFHGRPVDFAIEDRGVFAYSAATKTLTLNAPTESDFGASYEAGEGFYLDNKLWMLDSPGEWFHDAAAGKLYVWMPGSAAPGTRVSATEDVDVLELGGRSFVTVDGLTVRGGRNGVRAHSTQSVTLKNCLIDLADVYAVYAQSAVRLTVDNCTLMRSAHGGIWGNTVNALTVTRSRITDTGTLGLPVATRGALLALGPGANLSDNVIQRSATFGIWVERNSLVQRNVILDMCTRVQDCSGIYLVGVLTSRAAPFNARILQNVVGRVNMNTDGTAHPGSFSFGMNLDDLVNGVEVSDNVFFSNVIDVQVHDSYQTVFRRNTFYGSQVASIYWNEDRVNGSTPTVRGNQFMSNLVVPLKPSIAHWLTTTFATTKGFISADSNRYADLSGAAFMTAYAAQGGLDERGVDYDFAGWRANWRQDAASTIYPKPTRPYTPRLLVNTGSAAQTFNCPDADAARCARYTNVANGSRVAWPVILQPLTAAVVVVTD